MLCMRSYTEFYTIRLPPFAKPARRYFIQDVEPAISLWLVPSDHNKNLRRPVAQCATYFHREMDFDFIQYSVDDIFRHGFSIPLRL